MPKWWDRPSGQDSRYPAPSKWVARATGGSASAACNARGWATPEDGRVERSSLKKGIEKELNFRVFQDVNVNFRVFRDVKVKLFSSRLCFACLNYYKRGDAQDGRGDAGDPAGARHVARLEALAQLRRRATDAPPCTSRTLK